jgi:methyl-accepting chemotaxis protein
MQGLMGRLNGAREEVGRNMGQIEARIEEMAREMDQRVREMQEQTERQLGEFREHLDGMRQEMEQRGDNARRILEARAHEHEATVGQQEQFRNEIQERLKSLEERVQRLGQGLQSMSRRERGAGEERAPRPRRRNAESGESSAERSENP